MTPALRACARVKIYRSKRIVKIGSRSVTLSPDEHRLVTALGMMDNRIMPMDLLMDFVFDHPVRISADRDALWQKVGRLRGKIGEDVLQGKRQLGYQLTGLVEFVG